MQLRDSHTQQVSQSSRDGSADRIRHMHDVLSDPYRCAVLYYLQESDEPVRVRDVAQQVHRWCQEEMQDDDVAADHAHTWLFQKHVLAMVEFGLITFDLERDTIYLPDDVSITVSPPWEE